MIDLTKIDEEDGLITQERLVLILRKNGIPEERAKEIIENLDVNDDGLLSIADDVIPDGILDEKDAVDSRTAPYGKIYGINPRVRKLLENEKKYLERKMQYIESTTSVEQMNDFCIYKYNVPVRALPKDLEGIRILHLSDLHFKKGDRRAEKLRKANTRIGKTDIVLCTGDYVYDSLEDFDDECIEAMSEITCQEKYFVLGNHDFLNKGDKEAAIEIARRMEKSGYRNLTKNSVCFNGLSVYGVDDNLFGNPEPPEMIDNSKPNILVMHNLDALNSKYPHCFDLILSGHLHSGEISFGILDGVDFLKLIGSYENLNEQKRGWKAMTWRTLSYISPGLYSHTHRINTEQEGVTLHKLVRY